MRTPPAGAAHVAGFVRLLRDCRAARVAPQPPHAPMLSAVMPNGQAAPGAGRCAPHRRGCTTLRDTLPGRRVTGLDGSGPVGPTDAAPGRTGEHGM